MSQTNLGFGGGGGPLRGYPGAPPGLMHGNMSMANMQPHTNIAPQLLSPTKDVNLASVVMLGQETVQDIVTKTTELFQHLKQMQLPSSAPNGAAAYQERRAKLHELLPALLTTFRKLRVCHDKIMEANLDTQPAESLLPLEENGEITGQTPHITEAVQHASEEHRELCEKILAKNAQLKEVMDLLRTVVWEINTMMAMRNA